MRAAILRQPDAWDVPTLDDDAETQIYFNPPAEPAMPALQGMPPVRMSAPIYVAPVAPVVRRPPPPPLAIPARVQHARMMPPPVVHTARVHRHSPVSPRWMVIAIAFTCVLVGTAIGCVIALRGGARAQTASASPAPLVVKAPDAVKAPTVAPAVTPIEAPPAPQPAAADTRNVVFVEEAQPVQAVEPAPRAHHAHRVTVAHRAAPVIEHVAATPTGTLELSTKPPCEIVIDGKATGLMTPRRGIPVAAGAHEVTLTNADMGIQLTTEVTVSAGQATRVIRDFTK